jgi:hypothetical protein
MSDAELFVSFILSVIVLIAFFMLVNRVGSILIVLRALDRKVDEQIRYLSTVSVNIALIQRTQQAKSSG